ncbi:Dihydroorotase [subsurface metagenome]|nr:amidohydrolase family protein [Dehalococcoidia bacterium]
MKSLLIKDGRIIDPGQGIDERGSLLLSEGKVVWRGVTPPHTDYDILYAEGMVVCPGFVDLHCHLRQPGFEEKETIATGTRAAARGGFTTVCAMPNTSPPLDTVETVAYVKAEAEKSGVIRVLSIGCVTRGRKGEELADMADLAHAGVVGFSDDGSPVKNPDIMHQALEKSKELGLPVIDHCEEPSLIEGGQMNEGELAERLGLRGIPPASEEIMVSRDIMLARMTGGHVHIAHVSTTGAVALIRDGKRQGVRVTAEVTPHHLTLTEEECNGYNTNAKVSPPLRTRRDNQSLIKGLKDGVIDIIATDHAPHARFDKECDFTRAACGISNFETALGSLLSPVHSGQITLNMLIARLTLEPAKLLKDDSRGTLKIGAPADITVFDPYKEWTVDPSSFVSKGKNTPLAGRVLKGRTMATIYGGKLVYKDDSITFIGEY